ncbi:ATP-dependent DNA helicase PIF1 [Metarhizium guizhouense ARSEF 977]|uniref:ATP-dependent DNA helicase n=1 Tax=Metarhizium guizhouense (strain ARSEF 977) TaxID=1276136 RepID=A0A0B4GP46_METGA|nr:ATP-dependent DNA helicase PIF1 [Metarhizium guizhouense ARSEF 977]
MDGDSRLRQQFARDFRVRRSCLLEWLHYLQRHHPGYRDIVLSENCLQRLPDGSIVDFIASQVADMRDGEIPQGPVEEDVEEAPSHADTAIPNLQVTETELNALQSRILDDTPDRGFVTNLEQMPHSTQSQHQMPLPSIRRTPINEFNHSQLLDYLARDYLAHAMRWRDGRFTRRKTSPFVALNTLLRAQVRKRCNYFVKQHEGRRQALTRADLEEAIAEPDEPEAIQSIMRQATVIRATRPYWYKQRKELEAYAYNLGRPGLFVTASAADYHWESLYRHMPRFQECIVVKQKFNLIDFWGRYEWQGRGSSHHHGLYWLSGHPDLDPDNDESRTRFARVWGYHVSAVNPEPQRIQAPGEGNPLTLNLLQQPLTVQLLSMVVNRVQRHHCNNYCMQLNKRTKQVECRFGFPHGQRLLASLNKLPHSKHWCFRGERNDSQINHYNRLLTVAWLANTDISPCTSLQQVVDYAAKYCSKSEKKSESFAQIGKALMPRVKDQNPLISFTSKLLNQLVAERDYSKQEVSHLLLGLPLQEGSRTCLYVDCRNPDRHSRSLQMDGDEVDETPNVYEKYKQRPESLGDLAYVSFLKYWNFRPRDPSKWKQWQPGNVNGRPRTYPELRASYWKDLIASHPIANDVEVLGPQWRDRLNPQQRLVYDTCMGHFLAKTPAQILLHVDGGGGTGKSFLIKVLSSHLQATALPDPSPICRVAPTGVASNQIQGSTIHSLLRLPVGGAFTDLSPADAAALQSRLRHVKYLVIDEKSMLGLEQLARIDSRLRQAFPQRSSEFFGSVSVLLVGDYFQLPPVRQKPLYSTSTNLSLLERKGQAAYQLFDRSVFLTTVQRQAGDEQARFRQALQELRQVKLSIPSWNLLSSQVQAKLTQSEVDSFSAALRVYSTKAQVNKYNYEYIVHLNASAIQVEAKNQGKGIV